MSSLIEIEKIIADGEKTHAPLVKSLREKYSRRRKVSIKELQKAHPDQAEFRLAFAIVATS